MMEKTINQGFLILPGELVVKYYQHTTRFALVFLSTSSHLWLNSTAHEAIWKTPPLPPLTVSSIVMSIVLLPDASKASNLGIARTFLDSMQRWEEESPTSTLHFCHLGSKNS